ncbi:hypothetical protein G7Y89_g5134 [Cudoniella acicularis]|uniref:Uncharacterized protein n=1 Tax=Cudoniella acicularis TaxID=354080 RepID=A0A8H4W425_9HELO|nr:hypothetical protein G7Y89_g5134 [Cudoniella acicularis]
MEKAITILETALSCDDADPRTLVEEDLDLALTYADGAEEITPEDHLEIVSLATNLVMTLLMRYDLADTDSCGQVADFETMLFRQLLFERIQHHAISSPSLLVQHNTSQKTRMFEDFWRTCLDYMMANLPLRVRDALPDKPDWFYDLTEVKRTEDEIGEVFQEYRPHFVIGATLDFLARLWWGRAALLRDLLQGCKVEFHSGKHSSSLQAIHTLFSACKFLSQVPCDLVQISPMKVFKVENQSLYRFEGLCSGITRIFGGKNAYLNWVITLAKVGPNLSWILMGMGVKISSHYVSRQRSEFFANVTGDDDSNSPLFTFFRNHQEPAHPKRLLLPATFSNTASAKTKIDLDSSSEEQRRQGIESFTETLREISKGPTPKHHDGPSFDRMIQLTRDIQAVSRIKIQCSMFQSRFFVTSLGYIGRGPIPIRPEDSVFIPFGAKTPFILRKDQPAELYRLVGEAYVHGIMGGTAAQAIGPPSQTCVEDSGCSKANQVVESIVD